MCLELNDFIPKFAVVPIIIHDIGIDIKNLDGEGNKN